MKKIDNNDDFETSSILEEKEVEIEVIFSDDKKEKLKFNINEDVDFKINEFFRYK